MTQAKYKEMLKEKISSSIHEQLVDFSVSICEQLLPDYISFSEAEDYGNVKLMKEAITFCKENRDQSPETLRMKIDLEELEENIPDVDESEVLDSTTAINASCAIFELLEYFSDGEPEHILNIAMYSVDTTCFKIGIVDYVIHTEDLDKDSPITAEYNRLLGYF